MRTKDIDMILESLQPRHYGPFSTPETINLDRDVTILTGANDCGKSSVLRLIRALCKNASFEVADVNTVRLREFGNQWSQDGDFGCIAKFRLTSASQLGGDTKPDDILTVRAYQNPQGRQTQIMELLRGEKKLGFGGNLQFPRILDLTVEENIRHIIDWKNPNETERYFLLQAFGTNIFEKYRTLTDEMRTHAIMDAEAQLNDLLSKFIPPKLGLQLKLKEVAGKPEQLLLSLNDDRRSMVPMNYRGAGARKLLNIAAKLSVIEGHGTHVIVLLDEPENSLHADAQHFLRHQLEHFAKSPMIQIVYATHSSAMINSLRPESIRVLKRAVKNGRPTVDIEHNSAEQSFWPVRSSLGLSPADSLLFGSVTIIVEGISEVRSLPKILTTLSDARVEGFEDFLPILGSCHFLDGEGSSFTHACRLAKSQNANPVVFLDGDKKSEAAELKRDHPDVPVIQLPEGTELEQCVSEDVYFRAIGELCKCNPTDLQKRFSSFRNERAAKRGELKAKMFSKWVEWFMHEEDLRYEKDTVMAKTAQISTVDDIHHVNQLRSFVSAIRNAFNKSFTTA